MIKSKHYITDSYTLEKGNSIIPYLGVTTIVTFFGVKIYAHTAEIQFTTCVELFPDAIVLTTSPTPAEYMIAIMRTSWYQKIREK